MLREALQELRVALDNDDPIDLNDDELAELVELGADELVRRLPRYALEQGDLEPENEPAIDAREYLLLAARDFRRDYRGFGEINV